MVSDVMSVRYFSIKNDDEYDHRLKHARELIKLGYRYTPEPLKLLGDTRILVFIKPVKSGISEIKFEGHKDYIWKMLHDLRMGA